MLMRQSELLAIIDKLGQSCWQKAQNEDIDTVERASLAGRASAYAIIAIFLKETTLAKDSDVKN